MCHYSLWQKKKKTFDNIESWIKEGLCDCPTTCSIVLVGNNIELEDEEENEKEKIEVTLEEGKSLAQKYQIQFYEISKQNLDNVFFDIIYDISQKIEKGFYDLNNDTCGIKIGINNLKFEDEEIDEEIVKPDRSCIII